MTGFERIKSEVKDQKDLALVQTVDYLLTRDDLQDKFLNEEKSLEGMAKFIRDKGTHHSHSGWNYITDQVVYAWAVMYYSLPNEYLKINIQAKKNEDLKKNSVKKDNVVSMEDAKKKMEEKKEVKQISLFGGVA